MRTVIVAFLRSAANRSLASRRCSLISSYESVVGGYNIWTRIYSNPGNRFVSDKYMTTGRVQNFLPKC